MLASNRYWKNEWHVVWCGGNKARLWGLITESNRMEPEFISLTTNLKVKLLRHAADMCRLWSSISPAQGLMTLQVNEAALIKELYTPQYGPVQGRWTSSQLELPLLFTILKEIILKAITTK